MDKKSILESISYKGNGEIYLGVVGSVRTGKSTFVKKFMELQLTNYSLQVALVIKERKWFT